MNLSLSFLQKAYEITQKLSNADNYNLKLATLNNLSCVHVRMNNLNLARDMLNEAAEITEMSNLRYQAVAITYLNISATESLFGFHKESLSHAQKALK